MSAPLVLKFGGTSLAGPRRVAAAARRIRAHARNGRRVVAVVSAAGRSTDRLLARALALGRPAAGGAGSGAPGLHAREREIDRALATGEDRSAALLALALWRLGTPARSVRGGEAGLVAAGPYGAGRIVRVDAGRLHGLLEAGLVPVVSGFQAERPDGETVTLGRGGSDTSAVALAAALGAECHIVTDVEGVCERDPALHRDARPLPLLRHDELLALAEAGARVVHRDAARLAAEAAVPLSVYHFRTPPHAPAGTRVPPPGKCGGAPAPPARAGRMSAPLRRHAVGRFRLESGAVLEDVVQAYTLTGELNAAGDNLVLLFHSLTGTPDPREWWPDLIGPGRALDTRRWAVLAPNLLGSCYGTSPCPPDGALTPRDMAALARLLVDEVGARSVALAAGGSLGGMVALEWAAGFPRLTRSAVVFAAPAAHTAQAIGFNHVQRTALELGGEAGLALARMAAMLTYRTPGELEARFGRRRQDANRYQVQSYLSHQGAKLVHRFDARSYRALLGAMDAHDVGRGRGGVAAALRPLADRLVGVGITGDLLYPPGEVRVWTDAAGARYRQIESIYGHDAFLLEPEQVGAILAEALAGAGDGRAQVASGRADALCSTASSVHQEPPR